MSNAPLARLRGVRSALRRLRTTAPLKREKRDAEHVHGPSSPSSSDDGSVEADLDDVRILPHLDLASDETRGHRVDPLREVDRAPCPDDGQVHAVLGHARGWQRQQARPLLRQKLGRLAEIESVANFADEGHVRLDGREVSATAQDEGLLELRLENVMRLLGDAVLMRFARLDPRRRGAVVLHDGGEASIELAAYLARMRVLLAAQVTDAMEPQARALAEQVATAVANLEKAIAGAEIDRSIPSLARSVSADDEARVNAIRRDLERLPFEDIQHIYAQATTLGDAKRLDEIEAAMIRILDVFVAKSPLQRSWEGKGPSAAWAMAATRTTIRRPAREPRRTERRGREGDGPLRDPLPDAHAIGDRARRDSRGGPARAVAGPRRPAGRPG